MNSDEDLGSLLGQACTQILSMHKDLQSNVVTDLVRIAQVDGNLTDVESSFIAVIICKLGVTVDADADPQLLATLQAQSMIQNIASASPLPSVSALQDFADYTRKEEALSEYWFIHDPTPGKQHKPTYGWAGGRPALDKALPEGILAFVSWESIVSATWEQLTGADPSLLIEGYRPGLMPHSAGARAVTLGEECLNYLDTERRDSEGQLVSYQKNDWLLGLALQEVESDSREATQVPGCLREGAINKVGDNCLSLENNFTGEALVHHVHDSNGEKRAVVIGLVLGRGGAR